MKTQAKVLLITAQLLKLFEAVLVFIIGLALIINHSFDRTISIIVGIVLLLTGFATLVADLINEKKALTTSASVNAGTIALGVLCFISYIPVEEYLALLLIVLGSYAVLEAILTLIFKRGALKAVIYLVIGALLLVAGILFLTNPDVKEVLCIIIGVLLLLVGLLLILETVLELIKGLKLVSTIDKKLVEEEQDPEEEVKEAVME